MIPQNRIKREQECITCTWEKTLDLLKINLTERSLSKMGVNAGLKNQSKLFKYSIFSWRIDTHTHYKWLLFLS